MDSYLEICSDMGLQMFTNYTDSIEQQILLILASQKENLFPIERSNGVMEKRMSVLYNNELERMKPCRLDDFVNLVFDDLLGMNQMFGDSVLSKTSKSVRKKKVIKEEWNKKRIPKKEKPSYQIGPGKSETIKIKKKYTEEKRK